MSMATTSSSDSRLRLAKIATAAVLVVGSGSGLLLNRSQDQSLKALRADAALAVPAAGQPESDPQPVLAAGGGDRRVLFSLRSVQTEVPPDPFQPAAMQGGIQRSALAAESLRVETAPAAAVAVRPAAKPHPAPAAAPAVAAVPVEELVLTGLVQGDPPVAVVQFQGQSLFLKIGDQVADSWRLVEVKERSAIFQMGARRVEVPIKGGSSE